MTLKGRILQTAEDQNQLAVVHIGSEFTYLKIFIVLGVYCDLPQPWTPYSECTYFQKNPRIFCWKKSLQWIPTSIGLRIPKCSCHCQRLSSSSMLLESKDWRFQRFDNIFLQSRVIWGTFFDCWKEKEEKDEGEDL